MTGGRVQSVWRYPVKSMEGEELSAAEVTSAGVLGDRAYALVDQDNKWWTAAKKPSLLRFRARFVEEPAAAERIPAVRITMPDGTTVTSGESGAEEKLSKALADAMRLRGAGEAEVAVRGSAPAGTLFDYATVHVVTTASLARLREAYPAGEFAVRRFRPNFVVETGGSGFVENEWVGRRVRLGDEVELRVVIACARCVMATLAQGDLPDDAGILRTAAELNRLDLGELGKMPCVGVYAEVVKPGVVRRGDEVRVGE